MNRENSVNVSLALLVDVVQFCILVSLLLDPFEFHFPNSHLLSSLLHLNTTNSAIVQQERVASNPLY